MCIFVLNQEMVFGDKKQQHKNKHEALSKRHRYKPISVFKAFEARDLINGVNPVMFL